MLTEAFANFKNGANSLVGLGLQESLLRLSDLCRRSLQGRQRLPWNDNDINCCRCFTISFYSGSFVQNTDKTGCVYVIVNGHTNCHCQYINKNRTYFLSSFPSQLALDVSLLRRKNMNDHTFFVLSELGCTNVGNAENILFSVIIFFSIDKLKGTHSNFEEDM